MFLNEQIGTLVDDALLSRLLSFHFETSFYLSNTLPGVANVQIVPEHLYSRISFDDRQIEDGKSNTGFQSETKDKFCRRKPSPTSFNEENFDAGAAIRLLDDTFSIKSHRREYPSAGGLYPIEVFILFLAEDNERGLKSGSYQYLPPSARLEMVRHAEPLDIAGRFFHSEEEFELIPDFIIVYQINMNVALCKYRAKGYRFALMEVGSMYQEADIVARSLGLSSRVWGGASDGAMSVICGTNPTLYAPAVAQIFGRPNSI